MLSRCGFQVSLSYSSFRLEFDPFCHHVHLIRSQKVSFWKLTAIPGPFLGNFSQRDDLIRSEHTTLTTSMELLLFVYQQTRPADVKLGADSFRARDQGPPNTYILGSDTRHIPRCLYSFQQSHVE